MTNDIDELTALISTSSPPGGTRFCGGRSAGTSAVLQPDSRLHCTPEVSCGSFFTLDPPTPTCSRSAAHSIAVVSATKRHLHFVPQPAMSSRSKPLSIR
jgi:hypothetical protein